MRTTGRRSSIERLLRTKGEVTFEDLARLFGVSEMTIRRDIESLEQAGKARRIRGGAISTVFRGLELTVDEREIAERPAKRAIAQTALGLITTGESIFLDAGTTAMELARALADVDTSLRVVTSNLRAVPFLLQNRGIDVLVLGGRVRAGDQCVVGPDAIAGLLAFNLDAAFLSAGAIHLDKGVTDFNLDETRLKQAAMQAAQTKLLLIDSTKFDRIGLCRICSVTDLDYVITNAPAARPTLVRLAARGVNVLSAAGPVEKAVSPVARPPEGAEPQSAVQ